MHFKRVDKQLPEPNREVIGFNKAWITEKNPDGTRLCIWRNSTHWAVVISNNYFNYETLHCKFILKCDVAANTPTHWCPKPIPPMSLTK